ncbi:hypothetical protein IF1G_06648 [Cordyceps javanica]|uniref:Uncharacterized protein n=1 Tax=Cordyceps javanica TaxID=43265 RepID=A0A545UYW8_9HYPO|nr:hypothetical protein IF1G_06648 [Cordyceps javanica]
MSWWLLCLPTPTSCDTQFRRLHSHTLARVTRSAVAVIQTSTTPTQSFHSPIHTTTYSVIWPRVASSKSKVQQPYGKRVAQLTDLYGVRLGNSDHAAVSTIRARHLFQRVPSREHWV